MGEEIIKPLTLEIGKKEWKFYKEERLPRKFTLNNGIAAMIKEFNSNEAFRKAVLRRLEYESK